MAHFLIVGCGFIGRQVAARAIHAGHKVDGLIRSSEKAAQLSALSVNTRLQDLDKLQPLAFQQEYDGIYYFAPPPSKGSQDTRLVAFLEYITKAMPFKNLKKIVLISTTGVYGNCQGDWIDETQETKPTADRAIRRKDAEETLIEYCAAQSLRYIILRVPGIYGEGKLPVSRIKKGTAVLAENESPWSNRIYDKDLVNIAYQAMHSQIENEIFNCSDGNPTTMTDYFNQVADHLNLPRPPQISLAEAQKTLSEGMLSYLAESKRIKPLKLQNILKVALRFPTLVKGLEDIKKKANRFNGSP